MVGVGEFRVPASRTGYEGAAYPSRNENVVIPPEAANAVEFAVDAQGEEQGGQGGEQPEGDVELLAEVFVGPSVVGGRPRLQFVSPHVEDSSSLRTGPVWRRPRDHQQMYG